MKYPFNIEFQIWEMSWSPHLYVTVPHLYVTVPHLYVTVPHLYVTVPHLYVTVPHLYVRVRKNSKICEKFRTVT